MSDEKTNLTNLADKASNLLDRIELFAAIGGLAGVILKTMSLPLGGMLMVLSMGTLAMFYFLTSMSLVTDPLADKRDKMIFKLNSMGCSVGIIAILFLAMGWPGFRVMVLMGSVLLIFTSLLMLISKSSKPGLVLFDNRLILRALAIAVTGMVLYLVPASQSSQMQNVHPEINADTTRSSGK